MSTQIAIRLSQQELAILDAEVAGGRAKSRSDAVRQSITQLDRHRQYRDDAAIMARVLSQGEALYPDLEPIPASDLSWIDR
ncbi:MAG: ribbon-helix-helix domain-containing protein [Micrococcales bacterium]|nr:ribbon-helix-helix domain-containing protein [Micrococcales bacterium]